MLENEQQEISSETKASISTLYGDILLSETKGKPNCIIPARKGSKRLKNKNKLLINGKPLVQYAIDVAKESDIFGKVIVTSDDMEILEMGYESGCLIHKRPYTLASDTAQIKHLCQFLLMAMGAPDVFCVLIPCNPFRTAEELKRGYELIWEKDANYVVSVVKCSPPPQWTLKLNKGFLEPLMGYDKMIPAQKLPPLYQHEGSFIFARSEAFFREIDKDFFGSKCLPYIIDRPTVDIDTQEDYLFAKYLMEVKNESL